LFVVWSIAFSIHLVILCYVYSYFLAFYEMVPAAYRILFESDFDPGIDLLQ